MSTQVDLGMPGTSGQVLLADPRGYCAGVDRAVITVEKALDLYGAPVYVRKQIVHNKHVVNDLAARGAIFVEELEVIAPAPAHWRAVLYASLAVLALSVIVHFRLPYRPYA